MMAGKYMRVKHCQKNVTVGCIRPKTEERTASKRTAMSCKRRVL